MHSLFRNAFFPKNKRGPVILKSARVTTFLPNILLSANIFQLKNIAISANSLNFFAPGLGLQVIWQKGLSDTATAGGKLCNFTAFSVFPDFRTPL